MKVVKMYAIRLQRAPHMFISNVSKNGYHVGHDMKTWKTQAGATAAMECIKKLLMTVDSTLLEVVTVPRAAK